MTKSQLETKQYFTEKKVLSEKSARNKNRAEEAQDSL